MNIKLKYAFAAMAGLACVAAAQAQEAAPERSVRDAMEESRAAPSGIPDSAPRASDIDRLFGDTSAPENPVDIRVQAGRAESIGSPLDDGLSLEDSDLISVDYPNEEIRTVLRNVADLYMLNLVVPETLQGTTSIKLRDVTWREIYSVVLDPVGYTFVEEGSIIKVVSKETLAFEPPTTEIFILNYADAATIAGTVKSLIDESKGGRVQVDKRTNGLIVSERASKMDSLRSVIERLDKPTEQVYIETRFIEVSDSDVKNIGVNWSSLRGYGVGVGPVTHEVTRGFDRERTTGGGAESTNETNTGDVSIGQGGNTINSIGNQRGQMIDHLNGGATVVDLETNATSNVVTNAINSLTNLMDSSTTGRATNAMFTADQFRFVISALKEQGNSRLISNPTVVTLNNEEAYISVGEQYPLPQYKFNEETGSLAVNGFEFKDIGIILRVTPSVNHKGLITLKVKPEVSSRGESVPFGDAEVPIINTRVSETQISLKDGYTMGIGGLMQSRGSDDTSHVPVLGKIPGLGKLFRHQSKEITQLNLLIFITARVLPGETADFEDVFSEDAMGRAGVDAAALKNR